MKPRSDFVSPRFVGFLGLMLPWVCVILLPWNDGSMVDEASERFGWENGDETCGGDGGINGGWDGNC